MLKRSEPMETARLEKPEMTAEAKAAPHKPIPTLRPAPRPRKPRIRRDTLQSAGIALLSLVLGVLAWHWASTAKLDFVVNFENVPGPARVFAAFIGHLQTEIFYTHIGVSLRRILISYARMKKADKRYTSKKEAKATGRKPGPIKRQSRSSGLL